MSEPFQGIPVKRAWQPIFTHLIIGGIYVTVVHGRLFPALSPPLEHERAFVNYENYSNGLPVSSSHYLSYLASGRVSLMSRISVPRIFAFYSRLGTTVNPLIPSVTGMQVSAKWFLRSSVFLAIRVVIFKSIQDI